MFARLLIVILGLTSFALSQNRPAPAPPKVPDLLLGAAWYPEQWPESRWEKDIELMQKANIRMVRVGEFAWSTMEPEEGRYELDWLERAVNLAGKHGIFVVVGTPSSVPPAWLTEKYPETVRIAENGRPEQQGFRHQYDFASPKYREFTRKIAEQLAKRFGHNPYVIAWQIDNEIAWPSHSPDTRTKFQQWLQNKYGTLENLNRRWTTAYNSQTYFEWTQIPLRTSFGTHPALLLNWKQFIGDTFRSYLKDQIDIIRKYADRRQRITTNTMGWFDNFDHYVVSQDLDFSAWDDPIGQMPFDPINNGAANDLTRGFKRKNFWVMETTAGTTGWNAVNTLLDKGLMRAVMWHDIGHGADAIAYWQWRDALNGWEQNHGAIVDVDGLPEPLYAEMAQVGAEFEKAGPALAGTAVKSEVAVLHSYESRWDINWQRLHKNYDPIELLISYYKPLRQLRRSVDIVSPTADLSQYKLVIAPGLAVLTEAAAKNLARYVEQGGNLVLGQRSGMKDDDNARWPQAQPGPLAALLGGGVEQYFALLNPVSVSGEWGASEAKLYAEQLYVKSPDTKVLMRYGKSNGWLDGAPAVITRKVGRGTITYVGVWMTDDAMKTAVERMLTSAGVAADFPEVPAGVEVYRRVAANKEIFVIENFSADQQKIQLPKPMENVLEGGQVNSVTLPVYGVAVLKASR